MTFRPVRVSPSLPRRSSLSLSSHTRKNPRLRAHRRRSGTCRCDLSPRLRPRKRRLQAARGRLEVAARMLAVAAEMVPVHRQPCSKQRQEGGKEPETEEEEGEGLKGQGQRQASTQERMAVVAVTGVLPRFASRTCRCESLVQHHSCLSSTLRALLRAQLPSLQKFGCSYPCERRHPVPTRRTQSATYITKRCYRHVIGSRACITRVLPSHKVAFLQTPSP